MLPSLHTGSSLLSLVCTLPQLASTTAVQALGSSHKLESSFKSYCYHPLLQTLQSFRVSQKRAKDSQKAHSCITRAPRKRRPRSRHSWLGQHSSSECSQVLDLVVVVTWRKHIDRHFTLLKCSPIPLQAPITLSIHFCDRLITSSFSVLCPSPYFITVWADTFAAYKILFLSDQHWILQQSCWAGAGMAIL